MYSFDVAVIESMNFVAQIKLGDIILADGMTVSKALKGLKGDENESKYGLIIISASEAEAPLDFKDGCTAELFIECQYAPLTRLPTLRIYTPSHRSLHDSANCLRC